MTQSELIVWAHRGGAREAPENTLWAFREALTISEDGFRLGLECDVHRTVDGHLAVIHDNTLERTTNGRGRVGHHRYAGDPPGIAALDAWRVPLVWPVTDESRVPTIQEVLALRRQAPLTIEIKSWAAAAALAACLDLEEQAADPLLVVTSFASRHLWRFRWKRDLAGVQLAPGLAWMLWFRVLVALGVPMAWKSKYARIQIPVRKLGMRWATPHLVGAAQRLRVKDSDETMKVDVWTVDDEATVRGLLDLGVDGIMTDCPAAVARYVQRWRSEHPTGS